MNDASIAILLVEDEPAHARLVQRYLAASPQVRYQVEWVDRLALGLDRLQANAVDVVLLDLGLPDSESTVTLGRVLAAAPDAPVVVLTTTDDSAQGVQAVKAGAQDHLPKARLNADLLDRTIRYAIERKRSERQLKQFNELLEHRVAERSAVAEQRAQSLRQLAAELSQAERRERRRLAHFLHDDLQQIIAAARMRLEMLMSQLDQNKQRDMLQQGIDLLEQSIDTARSLALDLSPPVLNERGLGKALQWLARRVKEQHELTVQVNVINEPHQLAEDTASLLLDATRELLFNVVKHANTERAQVTLDHQDDGFVELVVEDHGIGFAPNEQSGSLESTERFGLFSIRERLEAIGGSMEIAEAAAPGARVILRAPYQADQPDAPDADLSAGPQSAVPNATVAERRGAIRVLVVDDHRIAREGLAAALAQEPNLQLVGKAEDGQAALTLLKSQSADVVIMDVSMPGLSGIETTKRIKQTWPTVQVVGLSMHEPADMEAPMLAAGAFAYVSKSSPTESLLDAIRKAARAQSPASTTD